MGLPVYLRAPRVGSLTLGGEAHELCSYFHHIVPRFIHRVPHVAAVSRERQALAVASAEAQKRVSAKYNRARIRVDVQASGKDFLAGLSPQK